MRCWAYAPCPANWKGRGPCEHCSVLVLQFYSRGLAPVRFHSSTSLCSTRSDETRSTREASVELRTQAPPRLALLCPLAGKPWPPGDVAERREGTWGPREPLQGVGLLWKRELPWEAEPRAPTPAWLSLCGLGCLSCTRAICHADGRDPAASAQNVPSRRQPWAQAVVFHTGRVQIRIDLRFYST